MIVHKFDAQFTVSIISNESVLITEDMKERVKKNLQEELNQPKVIRQINQRFQFSSFAETRCEVSPITVTRKAG